MKNTAPEGLRPGSSLIRKYMWVLRFFPKLDRTQRGKRIISEIRDIAARAAFEPFSSLAKIRKLR
jgi:hypothetical protein